MLHWLHMLTATVVSAVERLLVRASSFVVAFTAAASVLILAASLVARPVVAMRDRQVDHRWGEILSPLSTLSDYLPDHGPSPAAESLEVAAAELGIQLAPDAAEGHMQPTAAAVSHWRQVAADLHRFSLTLVRNAGTMNRPGLELELFLSEHPAAVNRLVELLGGGPPLRWSWRLDDTGTPIVPAPPALEELQSLLAAAAASHWHRGEVDAAAHALAAAWQLSRAALHRSELPLFLSAQRGINEQLALLRGMDPPPPGWLGRLLPIDLDEQFTRCVQVVAWRSRHALVAGSTLDPEDPWQRLLANPVAAPIRHRAAANSAESLAWAVTELPQRSLPEFARGPFDAELIDHTPRWDSVSREQLPALGAAWQLTQRTVAAMELAETLLQVHELDARGDRTLLDDLAGTRASRVKGLHWRILVEPDSLFVALDFEPYPHPENHHALLPLAARMMLSVPPLPRGEDGA